MQLIVGLGNPGPKYANNRHNVGYMFVDFMAGFLKGDGPIFKSDKYNDSEVFEIENEGNKYVFLKPQTYMNNSGIAVGKASRFYSVKPADIIVVHDDLDIPLGKSHIQIGVGPQLHNGLESIENHLKTKDFKRIRIGVDARTRENWVNGESYVLHDFKAEEKDILSKVVFPKLVSLLKNLH